MLKIRLQRVGRKHEPVFRLVVTDSRSGPKSGKNIEILGDYDSRRESRLNFKEDRVKHWLANGAQVSDTVHNLMVDAGVLEGKKINVLPKKSPIVKEKEEGESEPPKVSSNEAKENASEKTEEEKPVVEENKQVAEESPVEPEVQPEDVKEEQSTESPVIDKKEEEPKSEEESK